MNITAMQIGDKVERCEAICCNGDYRDRQCQEYGELRASGRVICWLHFHASRNPNRNRPLEYVRRGPDLAPLLERSIRIAGGTP